MTLKPSREQFDAHAEQYAASTVHSNGPSLPVLLALADPTPQDRALDVATGTGHTALALAPFVGQVTGLDIAPRMLEQARRLACERGLSNAEFVEGSAEQLPFPDASFTLVTSRHAPHHFRDAGTFLREVRRVLAPGGRFVLADQITPQPEMVGWVDTWQRTRDPSHHTQRTVADWQALAREAGLTWTADQIVPYRLEFDWWTRMAGCTPEAISALEQHAREAGPEVRAAMGLEFDDAGRVLAHHDPMLVARMER